MNIDGKGDEEAKGIRKKSSNSTLSQRKRIGSPISSSINNVENAGTKISGISELDEFLNNKILENKDIKHPWNKLSRQDKVLMISEYTTLYSQKNNLTEEETKVLGEYLIDAMGKKRLSNVKEIVYDKENKVILSIPILVYNPTCEVKRRFTLKRSDSSVKTVTPKKRGMPKEKTVGKGKVKSTEAASTSTSLKDKDKDKDKVKESSKIGNVSS